MCVKHCIRCSELERWNSIWSQEIYNLCGIQTCEQITRTKWSEYHKRDIKYNAISKAVASNADGEEGKAVTGKYEKGRKIYRGGGTLVELERIRFLVGGAAEFRQLQ